MSEIFRTTILGSSAAAPTSLRHTTAQFLQVHNQRFLLDCAEGTQMQLRRFKIPMMKISHIFISHLHGDHFLGLPGLLFTYHLLGRDKDIHIYSPPGMDEIIGIQYRLAQLKPSYEIHFHELLRGQQRIYDDRFIYIETIEMDHRIPTYGFLIKEKERERNILKESIDRYKIPRKQMPGIKQGNDLITQNGQVIPNDKITRSAPPPRSYAFCSDTLYTDQFIDQIRNADLLYHEATFMQNKADIAREKTHSTTTEAATLAKKAGAGKLLIGHYSARYKELQGFLDEAKKVFPNTILASEGDSIDIGFSEE